MQKEQKEKKEKSLARRAVEDRGGLCFAGAHSDNPCGREATEPRPEPGEAEIVYCFPHALAHKLQDDASDLLEALEMLHKWIQEGAQASLDYTPGGSILRGALYDQRDELERQYFDVLVKERGARLVADGRPAASLGGPESREYPASLEAAEALVRAHMVSDALNNARAVVEDAPEDVFGSSYERFEIAAALEAVGEDASRVGREAEGRSGLDYGDAD